MSPVILRRQPEDDAKKRKVLTCRTCKLKRCVGRCRWEELESRLESSTKPKAA